MAERLSANMSGVLLKLGAGAQFGLNWPTWIAVGGFGLFCLLGCYATLLLLAGKHLPRRFGFPQPPSLRGRMLLAFVLVATLPAISLALVLSERATNERLETTATIMTSQAESIVSAADLFLQRYIGELNDAAAAIREQITAADPAIEGPMMQIHRMTTGILLMIAADASGRVVATTRRVGTHVEASDVHARTMLKNDYFTQPLRSGKPYISGGLTDPHGRFPVAAAISVPILRADASTAGVLMGFYDLASLSRTQTPLASRSGIRSVMVDGNGQVMFASANSGFSTRDRLSDQPILQDAGRTPGRIYNFERASEATGGTDRFLATAYPMRSGWQLVLFRPLDQIEAALLKEYNVALAWLAGALLVSVCLALALVQDLSGPLESLDESVRNFDLNAERPIPRPAADTPLEVRAIFEHFGCLNERLRNTYDQLHESLRRGEALRGELVHVIANREKEIEQRTEQLKAANATLERLSREDSLTGLANRRWFVDFMARSWQQAMRVQTPLSILIIDIDNFKAYNDNYGHQKGDICLKLVARAIRREVGRASDLVSRYGGEEFIVVLGDTPLEGGLRIAENIRRAVEKLGIVHRGAPDHACVTVSIGVTSTLPTRETQPETVLVAADRAMYNAKHDGKNKVAYSTAARTGTYQALCLPGDAGTPLC